MTRLTAPQRPPVVPELELLLAVDGVMALWEAVREAHGGAELPPPYWAFAWLGGQALARHVLDHPQLVRGRTVLDLATGSGLVALSAARAGAGHVLAADVDPLAVVAAGLNADRLGLALELTTVDLLAGPPPPVDVVLAGDVFYEQPMAGRAEAWLRRAAAAGSLVLVGDPVRDHLPRSGLELLATVDVPTTRDLEGVEVKAVRVLRVCP